MNFRTMPEASRAAGFMLYNYFTECEVMLWTGYAASIGILAGLFEISGRHAGIKNSYLLLWNKAAVIPRPSISPPQSFGSIDDRP
jgi:hypothetical protein